MTSRPHVDRPGGPPPAVLHVITSTQRRGAETFAVDLAAALAARGLPSEGGALAPGRSVAPGGGTHDVPVLGGSPLAPATLRALRRRAAGVPVVVAHGSRTLPACAAPALRWCGRNSCAMYELRPGDCGARAAVGGKSA